MIEERRKMEGEEVGTDGMRKGKRKAGIEQRTGGDEGWGERGRKSRVLRWTGERRLAVWF